MFTRFFTRGIIGLSLLLAACSGGKEYDLKLTDFGVSRKFDN
jgi:hypothetical protein